MSSLPEKAVSPGEASGFPAPVLVVDDSPEALFATRALLESMGFEVLVASSTEAGLRTLLGTEVAAILLDVRMERAHNFQTPKLIRARQLNRLAPIVFISASDYPELMEAAYRAGGVDFLVKPVSPTALRSKIEFFVTMFRLRKEWAQAAPSARPR